MSDNVVEFDTITSLDLPPERVLRKALEADLESVVIVGWDKEGGAYFASSIAAEPETLWLLELCKKRLLEIGDSGAEE